MKKPMGVALIVAGIVLLTAGIIMVNGNAAPNSADQRGPEYSVVEEPFTEGTSAEINKEKGDAFEKFVVQKFDPAYFKVIDWTSDKYVNGIYAESSQKPDLLMEFRFNNQSHRFYVECKWKQRYYKDGYELCRPDQLVRYRAAGAEQSVPVFIVAGVGGTASTPNELFCVPVSQLKNHFLNRETLASFRKDDQKRFFLDTEQLRLH